MRTILFKKQRLFGAAVFVMAVFLWVQYVALAAVAHDAASESHTGATGSTNQASFSWTHAPAGTPRGVLVFVFTVSATKTVTGVTYGGIAMTEITAAAAVDTATEPGRVDTYFLGTSIPVGAQTITVSRTNDGTEMYASASTQTAGANTEVYTPGIVLLQEDGTYTVQSVTDGSPGTNSVRYAAGYYGGNGTLAAGTGSTLLNSIDFGSNTATVAYETTAGQGARNVGFNQTTADDRAGVHLAVREIPNTAPTLSIAQPDGVGDTVAVGSPYNITYSLSDPEQVVTAAFYYDTDNTGLNGTAITGACAAAAEGAGVTCSWNTTGVTPGTYYVYGLTSDGIAPQVSAYSPGTITINPTLTTTLGSGTDPATATIAPGASATDMNKFTLQTNTSTETITSVTVNLSTANGVGTLAITDSANTVLGSTASPTTGSNTITVSGMSATTALDTFKVRVTPLIHTAMPAVPGGAYAITAPVTAWAGSYAHGGSDTNTDALTIDNLSPADVSSTSGSAGNAQVTLNWTNPADSDYGSALVLRRAGSAVADTPTEGATYTAGNTIGTATIACVVATPTATCTDTGLINGTAYHYKIWSRDTNGNYAVGATPTGSPFTPEATTFAITSSAGANGTISPLGVTNVAQSASQTYTITPNSGYDVATLTVDSVSVATSTSYTFTNVQATHTISVTFALLTTPSVTHTITSSAGTGGTIAPLGATTVNDGASQSYTITPDSGYDVTTLTVDSVSVATSTSYTFTNVQADHTIAATFNALSDTPAPVTTSASRPTTIIFSGVAFVDGTIAIVNKELARETIVKEERETGTSGQFEISFVGLLQGLQSFGIIAKDRAGRTSQTKFFLIDTVSHTLTQKSIIVPPTIDILNGQVSRGKSVGIIGSATPHYVIDIEIDGILKEGTVAASNGTYRIDVPTGPLKFGKHTIRTRQRETNARTGSEFSLSRTFIVSNLPVVETDLSGDGKIDIKDWSIFLARFTSRNKDLRKTIDLSGDGKVDISDFSIFIKTIRKK